MAGFVNTGRLTFLIPLIALVCGIGIWNATGMWSISMYLIGLGLLLHIILMTMSRKPSEIVRLNRYNYIWIFLEFAGIGVLTCWLNSPTEFSCESLHDGMVVESKYGRYSRHDKTMQTRHLVKGMITDVTSTSSGDRLTVELYSHSGENGKEQNIRNTGMFVYTDPVSLSPGDVIVFPCELHPLEDSQNRYAQGYASMMRNKGILYYQQIAPQFIIKDGYSFTFRNICSLVRDQMEQSIQYTRLNTATQNFLITLLLGDKKFIEKDTRELFADAGISHILALSGMHISIIAGLFLGLLYPFNISGHYKYRYAISILLIWVYVALTGAAPSAVRAGVMTSFCFMSVVLERKKSILNALLAAAFFILVFSPNALFDAGMQLSFMAVIGLITMVSPLNPIDRRKHHAMYTVVSLLIVSMVATFATFMISAYYFHKFPLMFLPVNLLVVPLLPFYVFGALIYLILHAVGIDYELLRHILDGSFNELTDFVAFITSSGSRVINLHPRLLNVLLWSLTVGIVAYCLNRKPGRKMKLAGVGMVAVSLGMLIFYPAEAEADGFIIQKRSDVTAFSTMIGGEESEVTIPSHTNGKVTIFDKNIIVLSEMSPEDCDTSGIENITYGQSVDYLIITRGCYLDVDYMVEQIKPKTVLLHPSLNYSTEQKIKKDFESRGVEVVVLRETGPYRYIKK